MENQFSLNPEGLPAEQLSLLTDYANQGVDVPTSVFREKCEKHLEETAREYETNSMINLRLARALGNAINKVLDSWDSLENPKRYWLAGAFLYFSKGDDDEPDFASPIGFEDDAEILNACLIYAGLDELCVNPEDYDEI